MPRSGLKWSSKGMNALIGHLRPKESGQFGFSHCVCNCIWSQGVWPEEAQGNWDLTGFKLNLSDEFGESMCPIWFACGFVWLQGWVKVLCDGTFPEFTCCPGCTDWGAAVKLKKLEGLRELVRGRVQGLQWLRVVWWGGRMVSPVCGERSTLWQMQLAVPGASGPLPRSTEDAVSNGGGLACWWGTEAH